MALYKKMTTMNGTLLIALFVSHIGWILETLFCLFMYGKYCDRGFLTLPFCPVYGFSVLVVFLLIGTPKGGGTLFKRVKSGVGRTALYFVFTVIMASAAEYFTGLFLDKLLHIRMWNYSAYAYNISGYVCLRYSLLWGALIVPFMAFVFPMLQKIVNKIPPSAVNVAVLILVVALVVDWIICLSQA